MDLLIYNFTSQSKTNRYRFFGNIEDVFIDWNKIGIYDRVMDQIGDEIKDNFEAQMKDQKGINNLILFYKYITKYVTDIINFGLHWESTPEGHAYWSGISDIYRQLYNQIVRNENN